MHCRSVQGVANRMHKHLFGGRSITGELTSYFVNRVWGVRLKGIRWGYLRGSLLLLWASSQRTTGCRTASHFFCKVSALRWVATPTRSNSFILPFFLPFNCSFTFLFHTNNVQVVTRSTSSRQVVTWRPFRSFVYCMKEEGKWTIEWKKEWENERVRSSGSCNSPPGWYATQNLNGLPVVRCDEAHRRRREPRKYPRWIPCSRSSQA